MDCVIYTRVSLDRTGEALAVSRQEQECRKLAKSLGLRVLQVYTDNDISATTGKVRPGFEAMLDAQPTAIIAWHQDRLLRLTQRAIGNVDNLPTGWTVNAPKRAPKPQRARKADAKPAPAAKAKTPAKKGSTVATAEGVVIAQQRHVEG